MELSENIINAIPSQNDKRFCTGVFATDSAVYGNRLKAIGFEGMNSVLDVGCGYGQWTFSLAELNKDIIAFDVSEHRIEICKKIRDTHFKQHETIDFYVGSADNFIHEDESFDGVFAYSSILFTDYRKTFIEVYRMLKKGGRFYFNTNDLGWYLYNLIDQHNPVDDFSPRQMAIDTIENTLSYLSTGKVEPGKQVIMPQNTIVNDLKDIGFKLTATGGDGEINLAGINNVKSFFQKEFYGHNGVYEVLVEKV